jgi:hypothetical protein
MVGERRGKELLKESGILILQHLVDVATTLTDVGD